MSPAIPTTSSSRPDGSTHHHFADHVTRDQWLTTHAAARIADPDLPGTYYTADGVVAVAQRDVTMIPLVALDAESRLRRVRAMTADAFWAAYALLVRQGAVLDEPEALAAGVLRLVEATIAGARRAVPEADPTRVASDPLDRVRGASRQLLTARNAAGESVAPDAVLDALGDALWDFATAVVDPPSAPEARTDA